MNLSDMVTIVRRDLKDEDSQNYRWTDDELERHIARALSQYSIALPLEQTTVKATTLGSYDIDISSLTNRVMIIAVEYPADRVPRIYERFALWEDTLTLLSDVIPDGTNCNIIWGKMHTLDAVSSTIPAKHEDLVAMGAEAYALLAWSQYAINQVNLGGTGTPVQYSSEGNARLTQFRRECRQHGRFGQARMSSFYSPSVAIVSMSVDPGP
jgi:hypothetical protein